MLLVIRILIIEFTTNGKLLSVLSLLNVLRRNYMHMQPSNSFTKLTVRLRLLSLVIHM